MGALAPALTGQPEKKTKHVALSVISLSLPSPHSSCYYRSFRGGRKPAAPHVQVPVYRPPAYAFRLASAWASFDARQHLAKESVNTRAAALNGHLVRPAGLIRSSLVYAIKGTRSAPRLRRLLKAGSLKTSCNVVTLASVRERKLVRLGKRKNARDARFLPLNCRKLLTFKLVMH